MQIGSNGPGPLCEKLSFHHIIILSPNEYSRAASKVPLTRTWMPSILMSPSNARCISHTLTSRWHSLKSLKWYSSDHTLKKSVAVRWYTGGLGEVPVEERPVVLMLLRQSSPISSNTTTSPLVTRGGLMPVECWCRTTDLTSVENTVSVTSRCWELNPRLFFTSLPHLPYRNQH